MPTLVQYAYESFTGDNVASMDRLPAYLPVQGYDRRYYAESFSHVYDGAAVTTWPDRAGSGTSLTPSGSTITGATAPVMGTVGRERVVRFNGATDALGQLYINDEPYTFTLAFYLPMAQPSVWLVSVADTGYVGLLTKATRNPDFWGTGRASTAGELQAGWHVITVRAQGVNTSIRVDNTTEFTYAPGANYVRRRLTLGGATANSNRARMDVAELVHWPRALTTAEIDSVHTALVGRYGI